MKRILVFFTILSMVACKQTEKKEEPSAVVATDAAPATPQFFEMRTYYCHPDKLNNLLDRFNDHTMDLFKKHGMVNLGYWLPLDNHENKLVYLLGYQNKEDRDKSWEAFINDPEWKKVRKASIADGAIIDSIANRFLTYTDYSPELKVEKKEPRIFSLRTYYTFEDKLDSLHSRFQDHTLKIFENNGINNLVYFDLEEGEEGADNTLLYFVTFSDTTARRQSWENFGNDPAWKTAYENSIKDGRLVDSLTAELLVPTAFSPIK
ncbi:NIPSNAP family protein [Flagellimonas sp. 2504JD4-2]